MPAIPEKGWMNVSLFVALSGRRKCRSQTSDNNMGRWKSRGSKSQRREDQKKEDQRRERVRRKKMHVRENVEKSQFTVFFRWFVAPEGRKVGSLKKRVRSHLARWEMKNCTPLWREAHFQIKMYETHHSRTTLKVDTSKKCTPLWREAHFQVKGAKKWLVRRAFGRSDVASRGRRCGLCTLSKVSKTCGFCSNFDHNHHYTPLHYSYNYITLHYTNYITLHYATLHYTTLISITTTTTTTTTLH